MADPASVPTSALVSFAPTTPPSHDASAWPLFRELCTRLAHSPPNAEPEDVARLYCRVLEHAELLAEPDRMPNGAETGYLRVRIPEIYDTSFGIALVLVDENGAAISEHWPWVTSLAGATDYTSLLVREPVWGDVRGFWVLVETTVDGAVKSAARFGRFSEPPEGR